MKEIPRECVFQTLLHNIQNREPYSKQQCAHLLMAQRQLLEGEEDTGDTEGEDEGDTKEYEDEGEDLIYQPEDLREQPYEHDVLDESNQPIIIPSRGLDFAEDSNREISEDEYDDSQTPSDWSEGLDENDMVDNAIYVPEDKEELEDLPEENQEKAWLELQQVLKNIRSSQL